MFNGLHVKTKYILSMCTDAFANNSSARTVPTKRVKIVQKALLLKTEKTSIEQNNIQKLLSQKCWFVFFFKKKKALLVQTECCLPFAARSCAQIMGERACARLFSKQMLAPSTFEDRSAHLGLSGQFANVVQITRKCTTICVALNLPEAISQENPWRAKRARNCRSSS